MKTALSLMIGWFGFFFLSSLTGCNRSDPPVLQSNKGMPAEATVSGTSMPKLSDDPQTQAMNHKYNTILAGKGKMIEDEVITLLGPAHKTAKVNEGVVGNTWDNSSWIRIEFQNEKASKLSHHISPLTGSKTINEDNFKKLKQGMTKAEINSILGFSANMIITTEEGNPLLTWRKANLIQVFFKDGKVDGCLWESTPTIP
jgi:hypothetical protein